MRVMGLPILVVIPKFEKKKNNNLHFVFGGNENIVNPDQTALKEQSELELQCLHPHFCPNL